MTPSSPFPSAADAPTSHPALADLDAFVEAERVGWNAPGVALAVVQGDRVIHSRGYGLRDVAQNLPMTNRTLCAIASVSKSMTVATLAVLARQGKMDWDRPVREYLPEFRLFDSFASERVTPRDLVTHRTGVPRHDWVWYGNGTPTRAELIHRLRYLPPSRDLRAQWQYNNLMYVAAGYLAGRLAGTTWEEAIRRLLFTPLGMERAGTSIPDLLRADDFACAYRKDDAEQVHAVPYYDASDEEGIDPLGPAGSVVACVDDMARYLRMQLARGRFEGAEILAESDALAMQSPQMVMPDEGEAFPETGPTQYGMGFRIFNYRGHKLVRHGGALDGFSTNLAFLPDAGIGVIAIANISGTVLPSVLTYGVFDRLLGLEPVSWSARYHELEDRGKASETVAKEQGLTTRRADTRPAHSTDEYVGSFTHPAYGTVKIGRGSANAPQNPELEIHYHGFASPLHHFHYEVWETPEDKLNHLERMRVAFDTEWNGDVQSLRIPLEPQVDDIVFTRIPDPSLSDRRRLEPFVGAYSISAAQIYHVTLREGSIGNSRNAAENVALLMLTLPDQPTPYDLRPIRAGIFEVVGRTGFRVEFVVSPADGITITGIALHTLEGSAFAARVPVADNGA